MTALPIERNSVHLVGEYFVAAELYRRGFSVALTIGNAKAIDILAEKGGRVIETIDGRLGAEAGRRATSTKPSAAS